MARTNFGIKNYIHLSLTGALKDPNVKSYSYTPSEYKALMAKDIVEMEKNFREATGMSSQSFLAVNKSKADAVKSLDNLFNSTSFWDIRNEEMFEEFVGDFPELIPQLENIVLINMFAKAYTSKGRSDSDNQALFNFLRNAGDTELDRLIFKTKVNQALKEDQEKKLDLISIILSNAKREKEKSFSSKIEFESPSLDKADRLFKSLIKDLTGDKEIELNSFNSRIKEIDNLITNGLKKDAEKHIKGNVETAATEIVNTTIDEEIIPTINKQIRENVNKGLAEADKKNVRASLKQTSKLVSHYDRELERMSIRDSARKSGIKDVGKYGKYDVHIDTDGLVNVLESIVKEFDGREMEIKADLEKTPSGNKTVGGLKFKNVSVGSKNQMEFYEPMRVAEVTQLMDMHGMNGTAYFNGERRAGAFLNALNFLILGQGYLSDYDGMPTPENAGRIRGLQDADSKFGYVLSDFFLGFFSAIMRDEKNVLIDVDGLLIPTVEVYKVLRGTMVNSMNSGSYMVDFANKGLARQSARTILTSTRVKADYNTNLGMLDGQGRVKRYGYDYKKAAGNRNWDMQRLFLDQTVIMRSQVLNYDDMRDILTFRMD